MNNHKKNSTLESIFKHNELFHAYRNILHLSNNKCYMNEEFDNELTIFIERNNKNIENIIYFSLVLKSRLRQKLLNDVFKTINEIDNEIKKDLLNKDLKKRLEEEKEEILAIFFNEIDETKNIINEHNLFLSTEIQQLKMQFISDKIAPFINDNKRIINTLIKEISALEYTAEKTKKELNIIRESEEILNKRSFFDLFKNSIPLKSEIESLNIEAKEKNTLSLLVEILNSLFSALDYGFSYTKIVETRHQLTSLYLDQIKQLNQLKNKKKNTLFTLKHYYKLVDIDYFLQKFIEQLELLNKFWNDLNVQFSLLKNDILLTEDIIIPIFSFLDDFALYYGDTEKRR
ncbi:alpha-xenorhabdolysin family binary toxin subunit B [Proteus sp. FME41]|uniref:alpha-xenorhabdolysin family binary toxin subunit B n=1 Tax=Proteus sp. FME41 TaxID=2742608 RepID=UPI0018663490|nr:alpha-xenorhabdolysin family binary toxin subunit B [Proteus sp. FME41]